MVVAELPFFENYGSLFSYNKARLAFIKKIEELRSLGQSVQLGISGNSIIAKVA